MKKIRLGLVGLGHRGKHMFRIAIKNFDDFLPIAFCDITPEVLLQKQEFPIEEKISYRDEFPDTEFYEDYDVMLDNANLDAVFVETPATCHANFCIKALKKNIAVLSDVPFATSLDEARHLYTATKESKAMFMAGANPNEWGFVEALYDIYQKGYLGKPYFMDAEYIHDCRDYYKSTPWRGKGYLPITYCTHSLGPLLRIMDEELKYVSCVSTGSKIEKGNFHDQMTANFTTESDVIVRITVSFRTNSQLSGHSYRIFGTEGYFERLSDRGDFPGRTLFSSTRFYGAKGFVQLPVDMSRKEFGKNASVGHGGADYALIRHFLLAFKGKCEPISIKEGLQMSLPGLFAAESAKLNGRLIKIKYPWIS